MLRYWSLDIICSSKLTIFLELRSRKTVRFSEQIMSTVKYPSIFSRQMKAIVYLLSEVKQNNFVICLWQACRSIIICQSQRLRWNDKTIIIIVYHSISFLLINSRYQITFWQGRELFCHFPTRASFNIIMHEQNVFCHVVGSWSMKRKEKMHIEWL